MEQLILLMEEAKKYISDVFLERNRRLFIQENVELLSGKLANYYKHGIPDTPPPPHLSDELTPSLEEPYSYFSDVLTRFFEDKSHNPKLFGRALEKSGIANILLLMGQRITEGSIRNYKAIPPARNKLISSANEEYIQGLTVSTRAWTKHLFRSSGNFWGKMKGTTEEKNKRVNDILSSLLKNYTWWNCFGHFKFEYIYEIRVPSGHGARWSHDGSEFIGFVEPFDTASGLQFSTTQ